MIQRIPPSQPFPRREKGFALLCFPLPSGEGLRVGEQLKSQLHPEFEKYDQMNFI